MEAPVNISTKWSIFLNEFANGHHSVKEAENKLDKIFHHIPAIFQEISSSQQSLSHLRNTIEKYQNVTDETRHLCYKINNCLARLCPGQFNLISSSEITYFFHVLTPFFNPKPNYEDHLSLNSYDDVLHFLSHILYHLNNSRTDSNASKAYESLEKFCNEFLQYIENPDLYCLNKNLVGKRKDVNIITLVEHFLVDYTGKGFQLVPQLEKLVVSTLLQPKLQIQTASLWDSVLLKTLVECDSEKVINALQRDMIEISPLILHNKDFKLKIKALLDHFYGNKFSQIPMFKMLEQNEYRFILIFSRLCSSVDKLDPTLVPAEMRRFLFQKNKIILSGGPALVKEYQLQLFYASVASDAIPSPSKHDYTKTKISGVIFQKMLDAFFSKGETKPELSTDELIEIYEFFYDLTQSEKGILEKIRTKLDEKFTIFLRVYNASETKSLNKLSALTGPEIKKLHNHFCSINSNIIKKLVLNLHHNFIISLIDYANAEDLLHVRSILDSTKWGDLYVYYDNINTYIKAAKAYFKLTDTYGEKRNYQAVAGLIMQCFPNREYIDKIKESFPELLIPETKERTHINKDDIDIDFEDLGTKPTLSVELDLREFANISIDQLKILTGLNISKFTFMKKDVIDEMQVVALYPDANVEYVLTEKTWKEKAKETALSWFAKKEDKDPKQG